MKIKIKLIASFFEPQLEIIIKVCVEKVRN